jgi:S-DNA-T family DNA segregation ATPase FtsK/SpoIIIE
MLLGVEEDEPKRLDVINAVGKRAFHCELATDVLVAAGAAGDGDREWRGEGGLALELDLPVVEHRRLMLHRQGAIASVLGVTDAWQLGPSPSWPLVVVVVDEAHTFFHERKGTSPEVKAHNALVAELSRLVEELIRKGRNVAIQVMLLTQRATGDAIPTRIRDNCQVAISFATRTVDGAVAALGEEIRQHPDASPVLLNDPAYVGVAVTSLPGRPGFHRVRTPQVDHHQVAAIIRATTGLRADPAALLADQAPGLRVVPDVSAPEGAA